MKKPNIAVLTLATAMTITQFAPVAHALPIFFDAPASAPGWFDGSGNPNGGFVISQNNGTEIGLRTKLRQDPNVINTPNNIYMVPTGSQPGVPSRAAWNYEMFVNVRPNNLGSMTLADVSQYSTLTILNVGTGVSSTIDPFSWWTDDSGYGTGGKTTPWTSDQWSMEQSENPSFGDFPLAAGYNMNSDALYYFLLVVRDNSQNVLNTVDMYAQVGNPDLSFTPTPEPGTWATAGTALCGLVIAAARKRKRT